MANKDFRDWVINNSEDRTLYWKKWIGADNDKKIAVNKARNAILKLKFKEEFLEEDELEELLGDIILNKHSQRYPKERPGKEINFNWWIKVAATVVIFLFTSYGLRYLLKINYLNPPAQQLIEMKKAYNPEGRKSRITLPDGSLVNLNAGSSLQFPAEFNDSMRVVELTGEAFFDVAENAEKPFIVKTHNIQTEVLGTTFNIRAFDDDREINVALVTGKVKVTGKDEKVNKMDHILFPGEKLIYNKREESYSKTQFDLTEETGWKDEILVFNNTDFPKFITLLERWYGVKINVEKAPEKRWSVNGHFKNESLEEVLIGVQFTYDIDYKIENKSVTLKCK